MRSFEVYRLIPLASTTPEEQRHAIATRWVETWKGDKVKCRLVAKDLKVKDLLRDKDELYAATPAFVTLKVQLTIALANRWGVWSLDIGNAFLHAKLPQDKKILVWPPEDQLQFQGYLWQLEKAMYGLRVAPKSWQEHFAEVLQRHNYKRGQYEACVFYYDSDDNPLYALVHVDDILIVGATQSYESFRKTLGENFIVKDVGSLNKELAEVGFLGRLLTRNGDSIHIRSSLGYIEGLLDILKLSKANSVETTGPNVMKRSLDADTVLSPQDHSLYRTCVGETTISGTN